ncbi:ACT domain-containing protein, partial [Mesorhizobium sp. M7A.F.Ca.CA.004.02.1.1]
TASFRCRMVTLNIHSSLEAVGFLAAITTRLAAAGMGVNPVSAFYHDHLFVPADRAEEALELLVGLAAENRS